MRRSPEAITRWRALYSTLADGYPGLVGALLARAEAQVLRLSCIYALVDGTATIDTAHLAAAYALWRYCDASARYIFGTLLGDPLADDILRMLRQMSPDGMTRTDINNALGRNYKSAALGQALDRLFREGLAKHTVEKTSGRPLEWWFATTAKIHISGAPDELNELSPPATPTLNSFNSLGSSAMRTTKSACYHTQIREQNGQQVCVDCGELVVPPPSNGPPPAFTAFTASEIYCSACNAAVRFRTLPKLDGSEVYLCEACDNAVGSKVSTPPATPAQAAPPGDPGGEVAPTEATAAAVPPPREGEAPAPCPTCQRPTTWLLRGAHRVCYKCETPYGARSSPPPEAGNATVPKQNSFGFTD